MSQTLVLATGNPHKVEEIQPMLIQAGYHAVPQTNYFQEEALEDGLSFVENALIKARFASERTGLPAMSDDSGIEVDALNGQPGIFSARFAADASGQTTDDQNLQRILTELENLPYSHRKARYVCAVVFVRHATDPTPIIGMGYWHGEILTERRTQAGIGYDDIFWIPQLVKTVSEIPADLKNKISHRARAVADVIEQMQTNNYT